MAAPTRRRDNSSDINNCIKKSSSTEDSIKLSSFMLWAGEHNFQISEKVVVCKDKSCAQFGMIAVDYIKKGEVLFQIPRSMLLTPESCVISKYIKHDADSIKGTSGWAPLLISLMYEYNNPQSLWQPYLDLFPDFKELDLPMFWPSQELEELLQGTGLVEAVRKDKENIEKEFTNTVLPFVMKHEDKFSAVCKDLEFYKKMAAFVMAYSFTEHVQQEEEMDENAENPPPVMVPMADVLNHVAKNNAQLNFEKDELKVVAVQDIKKGEEVYNTYGQLSNWHLLHMYGFAEPYPNNHWDTVDIASCDLVLAASDTDYNTEHLMNMKKSFFQTLGLYGSDVYFVIGVDAILDEEEITTFLKICSMSEGDLVQHMEDFWEDVEDDDDEISLSFDHIGKLPASWKRVLLRGVELRLKKYPTTLKEDEEKLKSRTLSSRHRYALMTSYGQKKILETLKELCL